MLLEISRMISWLENYGLKSEQILELIRSMAGEDNSPEQTKEALELEISLSRIAPDPLERAKLLWSLAQVEPNEEVEPEEITDRMQLFPLLLHAVSKIVETAPTREQALEMINAIITNPKVD